MMRVRPTLRIQLRIFDEMRVSLFELIKMNVYAREDISLVHMVGFHGSAISQSILMMIMLMMTALFCTFSQKNTLPINLFQQ
jgi:hypothetical protein